MPTCRFTALFLVICYRAALEKYRRCKCAAESDLNLFWFSKSCHLSKRETLPAGIGNVSKNHEGMEGGWSCHASTLKECADHHRSRNLHKEIGLHPIVVKHLSPCSFAKDRLSKATQFHCKTELTVSLIIPMLNHTQCGRNKSSVHPAINSIL